HGHAAIFPDHGAVTVDEWELPPSQRASIEQRARARVPEGPVEVLRVRDGEGRLAGYALVLDERGKYRPITFMVGVTPDFAVRGVEVMVYREDRGDEVRHRRFLRQYRGKRARDPIRTHRDIVNITGATISVNSLNRGVRRALATVEALYGPSAAAQPARSHPLDGGR
ncbi:MAG: FMN-binding protein, partial [Gemmatimonadetes bacterium]